MIKVVDEKLYEIVCGWFKKRGAQPFSLAGLSKRAYIVFQNDIPVVCAVLHKDETSTFGQIGITISDPDVKGKIRDESFDELYDHIFKVAKGFGCETLLALTSNKSLIKRYNKKGFVVMDENMVHLYKNL